MGKHQIYLKPLVTYQLGKLCAHLGNNVKTQCQKIMKSNICPVLKMCQPVSLSPLVHLYLNNLLQKVVIIYFSREEMDAQQSFLTQDYDVQIKQNRQSGSRASQASLPSWLISGVCVCGGGQFASAQRPEKMSDGLPCSLETGSLPQPGAVLVPSKPQSSHTTGIFMLALGTRTHVYVTLNPSPQLGRFTL